MITFIDVARVIEKKIDLYKLNYIEPPKRIIMNNKYNIMMSNIKMLRGLDIVFSDEVEDIEIGR